MSRLRRWGRRGGRGGPLALAALLLPAASAGAGWSAPASVSRCPSASGGRVVFPSADPHTGAGPGAILWSGDPAACGRASGSGVGLAPIAEDDLAGPAQSLPDAPLALGGLAATAATGDGRLVIAAGLGSDPTRPTSVIEGRVGAPFGHPVALAMRTAPLASAISYLGDVALAGVSARSGRVVLRLQHRRAPRISREVVLSTGGGPVSAVAVNLDYRGDSLVVWAQDGWIYRRVLRSAGRLESTERVAPCPPSPHLQALISDDNRGIVAWASEVAAAGPASTTRVYLDASGTGVHFGRPRLLEQFRNPPGMHLPDGSLRLVRLASESVMMAWTGISGGRYVVRAATVSLDALHPATLVSGRSGDGVLADLATGPHGEALAVWSTAPRIAGGGFDARHEQILSARGVAEPRGVAVFSAPEAVAGPGPLIAPRAAFDPASDTAVAVWQSAGTGIAYAVRRPGAVARRGRPAAHADTGRGGWPGAGWKLVALVALAAAVVAGRAMHARRARLRQATAALGRAAPEPGRVFG